MAQATGTGAADIDYLLYDGHGSTRQLMDSTGSPLTGIVDSYSYDGYGIMLGGNPTAAIPADTNLLYAGEQFDSSLSQYYLRARYYNQNNGRFNRTDPFAGNTRDPQSLHKYLYAHANPINNIDPTGKMSIMEVAVITVFTVLLYTLVRSAIGYSKDDSCTGSNCKCGPDITFGLKMLSAKLEADFSLWVNPLSDLDYLVGIFNFINGWGIYGLDNYLTGYDDEIIIGNNPSGYECFRTVTVSGKCHKGSTVNYWLWGRVIALQGDPLATATSIVTIWKKAVYGGEDLDEALMWTIAGHKDLFDIGEETKSDCASCSIYWPTPLEYKWGW